MANYVAPDTEFTAVANAIRAKGGTAAQLEWPTDFVSAIGAIQSGGSVVYGALRPDAELWKTYTYDKWAVQDLGYTIPAYTTNTHTVVASTALETLTIDPTNYSYYVCQRAIAIPTYNTATLGAGREEFYAGSYCTEAVIIPSGTFVSFTDSSYAYNSDITRDPSHSTYWYFYWNSAPELKVLGSGYGASFYLNSPTVSASSLVINSPLLKINGSATYFGSTYWNALTDMRYQYRIEVFRAPKTGTDIDGWDLTQQTLRMAADLLTPSQDLT